MNFDTESQIYEFVKFMAVRYRRAIDNKDLIKNLHLQHGFCKFTDLYISKHLPGLSQDEKMEALDRVLLFIIKYGGFTLEFPIHIRHQYWFEKGNLTKRFALLQKAFKTYEEKHL